MHVLGLIMMWIMIVAFFGFVGFVLFVSIDVLRVVIREHLSRR